MFQSSADSLEVVFVTKNEACYDFQSSEKLAIEPSPSNNDYSSASKDLVVIFPAEYIPLRKMAFSACQYRQKVENGSLVSNVTSQTH